MFGIGVFEIIILAAVLIVFVGIPIAAVVLIVNLMKRNRELRESNANNTVCPHCGNGVLPSATVCPACKKTLANTGSSQSG
jgi:hypothetical protein